MMFANAACFVTNVRLTQIQLKKSIHFFGGDVRIVLGHYAYCEELCKMRSGLVALQYFQKKMQSRARII